MLRQMKITGVGCGFDNESEYNVFFNNCQRFCRKLASAISKKSHAAQGKCLVFFNSHYIPTDTLVVGLANCTNLCLTLAQMTDLQDGRLVLRKDKLTLARGGLLFGHWALQTMYPYTKHLQNEISYIEEHGSRSYEIFDRKSPVRKNLEHKAVSLSSKSRNNNFALHLALSRQLFNTRSAPSSSGLRWVEGACEMVQGCSMGWNMSEREGRTFLHNLRRKWAYF